MRWERYVPSRLLDKFGGACSRRGDRTTWTAVGLLGGMLTGALVSPWLAPLLGQTMGIPSEYGRGLLITVAGCGLGGFFYQRSRIRLDAEDLRQCLTHPDLQPAGRAYLKAILALAQGAGGSKQTVSEIARELRTLLDTHYDLQQWLERWREAKGGSSEEHLHTPSGA